jgi:uncharacterized protein with FMN-binding domain
MADNKNVGNSLLALSSAAVLAVYAAGYVRTRAAAERFAQQTEARVRPAFAVPATVTVKPAIPPAATPAASVAATTPIASPKRPRRKKTVELTAPAAPKEFTDATEPKEPAEPKEPERAAPPEPKEISEPATAKAPRWKDGTYLGWGTSRHGDIQAQVVVEDGRIASATIAQCLTRYSCSVIAKLPPQVAERQSPEVDYVSGATQSTDAYYYAVVEALSKAK